MEKSEPPRPALRSRSCLGRWEFTAGGLPSREICRFCRVRIGVKRGSTTAIGSRLYSLSAADSEGGSRATKNTRLGGRPLQQREGRRDKPTVKFPSAGDPSFSFLFADIRGKFWKCAAGRARVPPHGFQLLPVGGLFPDCWRAGGPGYG